MQANCNTCTKVLCGGQIESKNLFTLGLTFRLPGDAATHRTADSKIHAGLNIFARLCPLKISKIRTVGHYEAVQGIDNINPESELSINKTLVPSTLRPTATPFS